MPDVVIGLDLGTGGVRAIAVDLKGNLIAQTTHSYPLLTPKPGWTEQNLQDWIEASFTASELMDLANTSEVGAHGVLFLPHLAGERSPHLDPDARGAFVNLSLAHTQADLIRAVLEGVAFSLREALDVISEIAPVHQLLATGGGARSRIWLQILAMAHWPLGCLYPFAAKRRVDRTPTLQFLRRLPVQSIRLLLHH